MDLGWSRVRFRGIGAMVLLWALAGCAPGSGGTAAAAPQGTAKVYQGAAIACSTRARPAGIAPITLKALPAQAIATLRLINAGGPFPYTQDDTVFGNYAKTLPRERYGYYHEFTVPTPGSGTRGARRIVTGSAGDDYYTPDHYASFDWISCDG